MGQGGPAGARHLPVPADAKRAPIKAVTFKGGGLTDSGTLMDLDRYQALKMTVKTIGGTEFLFIEAGGFSDKNPAGWESPLIVMKRAAPRTSNK